MFSRLIPIASLLAILPLLLAQEGAKADIRGAITRANPGSILVEGKKLPTTQVDKAFITYDAKTKIEKFDGAQRKPATAVDLQVGAIVEVDFVGPVAESYPVKARAGRILILPGK